MRKLSINIHYDGQVYSNCYAGEEIQEESILVTIDIGLDFTKREAVAFASDVLSLQFGDWFLSGGSKWTLDLAKLRVAFGELRDLKWLSGKITTVPEYKPWRTDVGRKVKLTATLMPEDLSSQMSKRDRPSNTAVQLPSLENFRREHPHASKTAFVIMQFSNSKAHSEILSAIRTTLQRFGLTALRADEKEYSDELLTNIRTYMHGCGFAVAVFERILKNDFNPNISLEVGYMTALEKPVCYLKDKTLDALHTDIVGKLYRDFDPQDPVGTIPSQLEAWLKDKALI